MRLKEEDLEAVTKKIGCTVFLKGSIDRVVSPIKRTLIRGGNAGLSVGGTGDALAGLIAGIRAQGVESFDACCMASKAIKKAGEKLKKTFGFAYGTKRVIDQIPFLLR